MMGIKGPKRCPRYSAMNEIRFIKPDNASALQVLVWKAERDAGAALSVERILGLKSREFQNLRPDILSKQIIQGE